MSAKQNATGTKQVIRLIDYNQFDFTKIVFSEPTQTEAPGGAGKFLKVRLSYVHNDGAIGPIIISPGKKWCFGITPDNMAFDLKTKKLIPKIDPQTGVQKILKDYQMSIVLAGQTGEVKKQDGSTELKELTEEEIAFVKFLNKFRKNVIKYAIANKDSLFPKMKEKDPDSYITEKVVKTIYFQKDMEDGSEVNTNKITWYVPLMYYAKEDKMITKIYSSDNKEIDPRTLTTGFHTVPNIKLDQLCIKVGKEPKLSFQCKLYDATVEQRSQFSRPRLAVSTAGSGSDEEVHGEAEEFGAEE